MSATLFDQAPPARLTEALETLIAQVGADWRPILTDWVASAQGRRLLDHVAARQAAGATIYPPEPFRALHLTPLAQVRAVILGQDPYHGPGQAEGLAFSVPLGQKIPPSLRNIHKELQRDLALAPPRHGSLVAWAQRGVLLLNTSLTVEDGQPASHAKRGWEALTDALIEAVARQPRPISFLLWGAHAQAKTVLVEQAGQGRHRLLLANHPSPLSASRPPVPFLGCGHFGQVTEVDWSF